MTRFLTAKLTRPATDNVAALIAGITFMTTCTAASAAALPQLAPTVSFALGSALTIGWAVLGGVAIRAVKPA